MPVYGTDEWDFTVFWVVAFVAFPLQQAFNATAVVRHMRRLQLGSSHEGPNPTMSTPYTGQLLMPEEDAGTVVGLPHTHSY